MFKEFVVIGLNVALGFLKEVRVLSKRGKIAAGWAPATLLSLMLALRTQVRGRSRRCSQSHRPKLLLIMINKPFLTMGTVNLSTLSLSGLNTYCFPNY